jgi:hypothetical protein
MLQARYDLHGENATAETKASSPTLSVVLGQGGLIILPVSLNSLLAQHTLFQVERSWTYDRMRAAIKLMAIMLGTEEASCSSDDGRRGSLSSGADVARRLRAHDDSPPLEEPLIISMMRYADW